jgi:hypothetical protein
MRRLGLILLATLVIYLITTLAMGTVVFLFAELSSEVNDLGDGFGQFWGYTQDLLGSMFLVGGRTDSPPMVWLIVILAVSFLQACLVFLPLPLDPAAAQVGGRLRPRIFFAALLIPLPFVLAGLCLSDALYFLPGPFKSIEEIALMSLVGCLVAWFISWLVWIPLLLRRSKGEPDAVERAVAKALRGTAVGWALTLPWHFVVRERQTCVCATGTFLGLVFGMIALVLVGGPLLLVFARDRRIRAALRQG